MLAIEMDQSHTAFLKWKTVFTADTWTKNSDERKQNFLHGVSFDLGYVSSLSTNIIQTCWSLKADYKGLSVTVTGQHLSQNLQYCSL